ncbi:hypothetical protein KBY97_11300 [Synechococcus sp. ATX 2A4]|uniref:hypothetical protein n=1 Tax=Synechococcus sp. ATX 2A4 TaxID=2823727 RepID=UPI0020CD306C|nr:hypothetical protein [Synechococcus sp. ATX 2A4]MCP9885704.1 hypothetical protein [Synechococcus sp. ATX 2A4]
MIQPNRRRIRTYLPEWVLAWVTVAVAAVASRCGRRLRAYGLLKQFLKRWPRNPVVLAAIIPHAVRQQGDAFAVTSIEDLWLNSGHTHYLYRLLFRRSMRPADVQQRLALFQLIAASSRLPEHYRWYSMIIIAYQAIAMDDVPLMRRTATDLERLVQQLVGDADTFRCQRSNRENRAKLLVSVFTALSRLYLALQDLDAFASVGIRISAIVDTIDFKAIDQDSAYRATRNLMRCLAIESLQAWHQQDAGRWRLARQRLCRVYDHCHWPCFDASSAQEDHRGFAKEMLRAVANTESTGWLVAREDEQIHHLITLIIKTTFEPRFLPKIRVMFASYLVSWP